MTRVEIKHLTGSDEYAECCSAFNYFAAIKAGRKLDPEIDPVACRPDYNAWYSAVCQNLGYTLATNSVGSSDAI